MQISKSNKLANVCYDIRGPVLKHAKRLEDEGQRVVSVDVSFLDSNGLSNKEIRETYDRLARMVANCNTLDDLQGWLTLGADDLEQLPEDVRISLRGVWKRRRDELKALV